jgi:hypothetical protein
MTITLKRFQHLLDVHGADPARWPPAERPAAERLLATDRDAVTALAKTRALDALIARDPGPAGADASRVLYAIGARRLPPQRRHWLWRRWPAELLNFDFTPAWPRLAALASVAVLGFVIGLTDLAGPNSEEAGMTVADSDIGAVVFAPDPLPETTP